MKTGTARQGMRVRIIGNHNNHGFKIGKVVTLLEKAWYPPDDRGYSFYVRYRKGVLHSVREIDIVPVNATVV